MVAYYRGIFLRHPFLLPHPGFPWSDRPDTHADVIRAEALQQFDETRSNGDGEFSSNERDLAFGATLTNEIDRQSARFRQFMQVTVLGASKRNRLGREMPLVAGDHIAALPIHLDIVRCRRGRPAIAPTLLFEPLSQ